MIKLKTFIKIIFILLFLPLSSCGLKKSTWEEQGQYTLDDSSANYVWKKGKQYVAVVRTIPVRGRNKNKTIHPVRISPSTIENSFSKCRGHTACRIYTGVPIKGF